MKDLLQGGTFKQPTFGSPYVSVRDLELAHRVAEFLFDIEDDPIAPHDLHPGDHIIAKRLFGIYWHHGLYTGENEVIHYTKDKHYKPKSRIKKSKLTEFRGRSKLFKRSYKQRNIDPKEVITRAESRLGKADYGLIRNNCEHFVEWCITGLHRSGQVEISALSVTGTGR